LGIIGLEMEVLITKSDSIGIKNQKSVPHDVKEYAYYASDNPLETRKHSSFRRIGNYRVKPTYLITIKILEQIFNVK
jgi:hypothetical protein